MRTLLTACTSVVCWSDSFFSIFTVVAGHPQLVKRTRPQEQTLQLVHMPYTYKVWLLCMRFFRRTHLLLSTACFRVYCDVTVCFHIVLRDPVFGIFFFLWAERCSQFKSRSSCNVELRVVFTRLRVQLCIRIACGQAFLYEVMWMRRPKMQQNNGQAPVPYPIQGMRIYALVVPVHGAAKRTH